MASVAIRETPSSPSQIAAVMKKVQTIIRQCMVSIRGTLGCIPSKHDIQATFPVQTSCHHSREHVPDRGARGVKRSARRHPGQGTGAGRPPVPLAPQRQEHVDPGSAVIKREDPRRCRCLRHPVQDLQHSNLRILQPTGLGGLGHHLLRAQPVHQCHISLYRRHLRLTKRRGRMLSAASIVLGRKPSDSRHPTGLSYTVIIFYFSLTVIQSGTVRLLDWNDSMTDIQLGMRFADKVQVGLDFSFGKKLHPNSKELILTTENFSLEELNLIKDILSEIKGSVSNIVYLTVKEARTLIAFEYWISIYGSEVQKVAQLVLDAVIQLCKVYINGVNWDMHSEKSEEVEKAIGNEVAAHADHVTNKYTVDKLSEVAILAANDGGSFFSVLNLSWKVLLANQSLRCAAQTSSLPLKEAVSAAEAKRTFLPIEFFLINVVRIISQYTTEAFSVYKEIAQFVIRISTLTILL
ncbi:hypothetical protein M9H77_18235 [Catharanthus roseus]|uniref:Uncharacterized protein n=1 Tax=Catharanthus roseus TaxID=4058 RepID=A0ACC0B6W9_CATRO|nr:hypothetical protein M9H77_18235 [Catharanthus roseus]